MIKHSRIICLCCVMLIWCAGSACAGAEKSEKIDLKLHLQAGQVYTFRLHSSEMYTFNVQGEAKIVRSAGGVGLRLTVDEVSSDGVATVKVTFMSVLDSYEDPDGKYEYNSEKTGAPVPLEERALAALVDRSYRIKVKPSGEISEVLDGAKLANAALATLADIQEPYKSMAEEELKELVDTAALKSYPKKLILEYDDKPVALGQRWSYANTVTVGIPNKQHLYGKVTDRTNGNLNVKLYVDAKPYPDAEPMHLGSMRMKMQVTGKIEGNVLIEEASGMTKQSRLIGKFDGKAFIEDSDLSGVAPFTLDTLDTIERL